MATRIYTGVGGKARKVKSIYVGVNGKARSVKAVYVGVNGKARLCWKKPGGIVRTQLFLNVNDGDIKGFITGVVGNYILAAGGSTKRTKDSNSHEILRNNVVAFDKSFTRSNATSLSRKVYAPVTANTKDYILIGGGNAMYGKLGNGIVHYSTNNAYDGSLTKVTCPDLYRASSGVGTTTLAGSAFYAGGEQQKRGSDNPNAECRDAYIINNTLTLQSLANLGRYISDTIYNVATVGNYAIVGNGNSYDSDYEKLTDAYNSKFSKVSISSLSYYRSYSCMIGMKSYALTVSCDKQSEAYDTSLTKISAAAPAGQGSDDSLNEIIGKYNSFAGYGVFMWTDGGICYYDDNLTLYQYTGEALSTDIRVDSYYGPYCVSFGKYVVGTHNTEADYNKGKVFAVYECV